MVDICGKYEAKFISELQLHYIKYFLPASYLFFRQIKAKHIARVNCRETIASPFQEFKLRIVDVNLDSHLPRDSKLA